jgi:hypothetical protein
LSPSLSIGLTEEIVPEDPKIASIRDRAEPLAESLAARAQRYRDEIERIVMSLSMKPTGTEIL